MADALLFLHRVQGSRDIYDTGSVQSPGSIRDQILRGQLIAERAIEDDRIGVHKPLLVVGAGAAGVSAALTAADRGVLVHLVECEDGPFSRQRACATRMVDPSVYEWPLGHHTDRDWGYVPKMALAYGPAYADQLATRWRPLAVPTANLKTYWEYNITESPRPVGGRLLAELHPVAGGRPVSVDVAAVLWASGAGDESASSGTYHGYRFWDTDPYGSATLIPNDPARIVISGGGDGALQDLLRLAFDPARVAAPRDLLPLLADMTELELRELSRAEEQAQRALIWNGGEREKRHDHSVLAHLHQTHANLATSYAGRPGIAQRVRELLRDPAPSITFVHPCDHFSRCYALNRLVVLLLLAVASPTRRIIHLPHTAVAGVSPSRVRGGPSHFCVEPTLCHGKDHEVAIARKGCTSGPLAPTRLGDFNIVVLRHGFEPGTGRTPTLKVRRQLWPYKRL